MKRMIMVAAHPGDESLMSGGTIAKYIKNDWEVYVLCATHGDKTTYDTTDMVVRELRRVTTLLGIKKIFFLHFKENQLPKVASGELEEAIYKVLYELTPDVVITPEPSAMNSHPDYKRLATAATYAFQKYARSLLVPVHLHRKLRGRLRISDEMETASPPTVVPKLYYACVPESIVDYFQKEKFLPKEAFGQSIVGVPDDQVTTIIDITSVAIKKAQALDMYKTQQKDLEAFLSMPNNPLAKNEYYVLRMVGIHESFMGKNDTTADRL